MKVLHGVLVWEDMGTYYLNYDKEVYTFKTIEGLLREVNLYFGNEDNTITIKGRKEVKK